AIPAPVTAAAGTSGAATSAAATSAGGTSEAVTSAAATSSSRPILRSDGAVRSRSIAVMLICAGLACGACATDAAPVPGGSAQAPAGVAPAPGAATLPAAHVGKPSVLVRNLA